MNDVMTTDNLIRSFLVALDRRDLDAMVACFGEDAELDITGSPRVIGIREIRFALAERLSRFEETTGDIITLRDDSGFRGAAEFTLRGRYRANAEGLPPADGQAYSLAAGLFCEVEEGAFLRLSLRFNPLELTRQVQKN